MEHDVKEQMKSILSEELRRDGSIHIIHMLEYISINIIEALEELKLSNLVKVKVLPKGLRPIVTFTSEAGYFKLYVEEDHCTGEMNYTSEMNCIKEKFESDDQTVIGVCKNVIKIMDI